MPSFATHFGTGIGPAAEGGTLGRSRQSYLAFPSGMAGVCAALDRVKQRPVGICKQDKQDLSAALEGLPKGRATTESQAPSYKRMFNQEAQGGNTPGGVILAISTKPRV